ncbi:hypothetical protein [Rickettsia endosymbiont of Halotydeus destructor]|uniref:hypothetical protein n=1 Tax=Rickettsia endosymbiont of Halotydeus destructor TaxID=2996754 RepID=UPI003BB19C04
MYKNHKRWNSVSNVSSISSTQESLSSHKLIKSLCKDLNLKHETLLKILENTNQEQIIYILGTIEAAKEKDSGSLKLCYEKLDHKGIILMYEIAKNLKPIILTNLAFPLLQVIENKQTEIPELSKAQINIIREKLLWNHASTSKPYHSIEEVEELEQSSVTPSAIEDNSSIGNVAKVLLTIMQRLEILMEKMILLPQELDNVEVPTIEALPLSGVTRAVAEDILEI